MPPNIRQPWLVQVVMCITASYFLGLPVNANTLLALIVLLPAVVLFVGFGLLTGSIMNDKQVGGICGALLTNVGAWLSGTWFDLNLVGGAFKATAYLLPFAHAVDATRAAITGNYASIFPHLCWVAGYAVVVFSIAVLVFKRKMCSENV